MIPILNPRKTKSTQKGDGEMTRQRQVIYDYLMSTKSHPTAEEIYLEVKANMPSIAFGTVYRNLSLMTKAGEIRKITIPEHPDRYDGDMEAHDHLMCTKCTKLCDIPPIENVVLPKGIPDGTVILGCEVTVKTICPECINNVNL